MAVKYTIPYRSIDDTQWRIDILNDSYTDDPITVRGFGDNACTIEYDGGVDDPFDNPVVSSKANIQLINQGEVDMDELQEANERDFIVEVYRGNVLKWKGYLITDNIQQSYLPAPSVVQLSAIDGLNMLGGISFSINNLPAPPGGAIRCPLNWLRLVLFREQNLGLMLPIRWHIGLANIVTEDDPLAGLMPWSPYGEGIEDKDCRYILEGIVKCMKGARIFQADGAWNIFPPIDIIGGEFTYNECDATLGIPTITQHSVDINRLVVGSNEGGGDYYFIREDALITVKPPLNKVDVEYDADRRENILPNGGFDIWPLGSLAHWSFADRPDDSPDASQYESIRQDGFGSSVLLSNGAITPATNSAVFQLTGGLPIDANLLFKRFTWGFSFMALEGFDTYSEQDDPEKAGQIKWEGSPLRARISYEGKDRLGAIRNLYLNVFGYWQWEPVGGYFRFLNATYDGDDNVTYVFAGEPVEGETIVASFGYDPGGGSGTEIVESRVSYTVTAATAGDLLATIQEFAALCNAEMEFVGSPLIESYAVNTVIDGVEVVFDTHLNSVRTWTNYIIGGNQGLLPGNWLPITIDALNPGDAAAISFQGKGGNTEIIFPDPGILDGSQAATTGVLKVEFAVLPYQKYVLDDVYFRLEDNNDVYRASVSSRGNSQSITLGISSSFSGFMVSNLMRSYHQSNTDFLWTDGTTVASLTEHYARAVMRWRYKSSKIFNGTINTRTKDWSFLEIYAFSGMEGRKFLPLNAKYNTELCEVNLVAMEGRNDGTGITVQHYASNNLPLSNYGG